MAHQGLLQSASGGAWCGTWPTGARKQSSTSHSSFRLTAGAGALRASTITCCPTASHPHRRRIDHIKVCDAWTQLEGVAAEEGLVALGYQRSKYGAAARIFQFAKLYLYSPAASVRTPAPSHSVSAREGLPLVATSCSAARGSLMTSLYRSPIAPWL